MENFDARMEQKLIREVQNNPKTSAEKIRVIWISFSTTNGYLPKLSVVFDTSTVTESHSTQNCGQPDPVVQPTQDLVCRRLETNRFNR